MQKINFNFHDRKYNIRDRKGIKKAVEYLFIKERIRLKKLEYVFCSDSYLLEINNTFLNHDFFTDIITFDLTNDKNGTEAEIYISIDRVIENAKSEAVPIREELCRVIFHGALHLCGYSDKKKKEKIIMRNKEDLYLKYYLK